MAEASADSLKFNGIGLVGKAGAGLFKINASQFGWKCTDAGSDAAVQYPAANLQTAEWQKACGRKCLLKLCFKDGGGVTKFTGFDDKDLASLKVHLEKHFKVLLSEIAVVTDGWSWGELNIESENEVKLMVGDKLAFEVPLSEVDQVTSHGKADVNFSMQPSALQNDETLHEIRFQVAPEWMSAESLREELHRKGGLTEKGEALGRVSDIMLVAPRGKHDIQFFRQSMKVHGKTQTYTVKYTSIARLFLLTPPGKREISLVVGLDQPMRSGAQLNHWLVFDMIKDSLVVPDLQKEKMEAYSFQPETAQPVHSIIGRLLKDLSGKTIVAPASEYKSKNECSCIRCSHKAQSGYLFPLKRSIIFINKPVVWVQYQSIDKIIFSRGMSRARSFDIQIWHQGNTACVEFIQIESYESEELIRFLKSVNVRLEGHEAFSAAQRKSIDSSGGEGSVAPERQFASAAPSKRNKVPLAPEAADDDDEEDEDFESNDGESSSAGGLSEDEEESADEKPKKKRAKKS
jgi:structure-specific recognition protein 1